MNAGTLTIAAQPLEQAGLIKATSGGLAGEAQSARGSSAALERDVRVVRRRGRAARLDQRRGGQVSRSTTLDGQKVLQKAPDNTIFKRVRAFIGPTDLSNYTFEADVRSNTKRRQMADIGITAQRYSLVLYGNSEELKLEPWTPEIAAHRHREVPLEGRHLVPPEAARREPAGRQGQSPRQGLADRPKPSPRSGPSTRPIRSATGRARPDSSPTPSSARISTTSS